MSGPVPGATCGVCNSPDLAAIHQLVLEGVMSGAAIGKLYGLNKDQVSRHVYKRHPGVVIRDDGRWRQAAARKIAGVVAEQANELERLTVLRDQLEGDMKERPRSDTARELRQVLQRIGELTGASKPRSVQVGDVVGLREQVSRWFLALEEHPAARAAMAAVTDPTLLMEEA